MNNTTPDRYFSPSELLILALLTLCWGINWPIMKIGVQNFPPLTFRAISMLGGLPILWLAARLSQQSLFVPSNLRWEVCKLAIPNMVVWHLCIILGIARLSSGRAATLGYTMPLWAVLFGFVLYREKLKPRAWFGLACAMLGTLLLLSSEFTALSGAPEGSLLALLAAAGWGYGTLQLKRTQLALPTICLTFWMLMLAWLALVVAALIFERADWRAPNSTEWAAIIYNAVVVFGFAHLAWFRLARSLPPIASGLSIMLIPLVGVFSGMWMLQEIPRWPDYAALSLTVLAMACVLLHKPQPAKPGDSWGKG